MFLHRVVFFGLIIFGSTRVRAHEESGPWGCDPDPEKRVGAEFKPGVITLDGHADDWEDIDGFEFSLLPALDPDQENEFKGGKMTIKERRDVVRFGGAGYNDRREGWNEDIRVTNHQILTLGSPAPVRVL